MRKVTLNEPGQTENTGLYHFSYLTKREGAKEGEENLKFMARVFK